ncbi:transporter [Streptomyces sp. NBC_01754]|uniref:transporter n=1 Tax=Streptomyces sp. NBC_01754 TaxID=2975930 RepID=UPI002DD8FFF9|nr:transporter [Streptomyces sp. NBC_01754]WSC91418.1 transporter [Streptomyces sp. NBC_01754]
MRRVSRRGDIGAALLLLVLDAVLLAVLLFGVLISGGLTGSPDRAAAGREASRGALVCLAVLLVSGGIATAVRAWTTAAVQVIVLGGAAILAWRAFGA